MDVAVPAPKTKSWTRAYPPLVLSVVSLLVAAFVLPSALNLPQSNPSTVLEYAPVPPEDEDPPPPDDGNSSSLGLGSSSSLNEGAAPTPPPPPPPPPGQEGVGQTLADKQCVGNPPRQTEDPMSPPCVPFFEGDNGGATYQGVTGSEIKVIMYFDVGCPNYECSKDAQTFEDLWAPPKPPCPKTWPAGNEANDQCDYIWVRTARAFNRYFNERFQTYGRRVHYYAYMTSANTEALRKKDAADLWDKHRPFAVIDFATYNGFNEAFDDAMAARGVLVFTSRTALRNDFFRKYAPLSWGFYPDVERWARLYSSYVCQNVAPFPVSHAGNPQGTGDMNGKPRKYGFFYTDDPAEPGLHLFQKLVREQMNDECGVVPAAEGTFPENGFVVNRSDTGADQATAVNRFQSEGVTTVLYLGGIEGKFSQAADSRGYYPEIVVAGDLENDNAQTARKQNPKVWQNAWGPQLHVRLDRPEGTPAYQAYKNSYPGATVQEAPFANESYRDHFMLYQAIQVAGPRLTPQKVDEGFHAIPEKESTSPYVASCFFEMHDYTCTKDAMEVWWDPTGTYPSAPEPGCFRMVDEGRRSLAWKWPGQDRAFDRAGDPTCTAFESRYQIDPG